MLACLSDTLSDKQFSLKCGVTTVSFLSFCFCRALIFFPLNIEKIQNEHISDEAQVVDHNLRLGIGSEKTAQLGYVYFQMAYVSAFLQELKLCDDPVRLYKPQNS